LTPSKLHYILTGLKSEIRRETDRDRIVHLCEMGLYYNRLLLQGHDDNKFCPTCQNWLPLKHFKTYRIKFYFAVRDECTRCRNKADYARRKKKRMKGLFCEDFNC